jgi:hypothetical protein
VQTQADVNHLGVDGDRQQVFMQAHLRIVSVGTPTE